MLFGGNSEAEASVFTSLEAVLGQEGRSELTVVTEPRRERSTEQASAL